MAQNNSVIVFVRKTSNDSLGRPNLKIDTNQVTNLKSLGFYMKKKQIYLESPEIFDPHISAVVRIVVDSVAKLIFVSIVVKTDDLPASTLSSSLLSPLLPPLLIPVNSLSNS